MSSTTALPLLTFLILSATAAAAAASGGGGRHHEPTGPGEASDLVRTSCVHANYPDLCLRTLASYSAAARTPRDLATAAVSVSLAHASRESRYLTTAFSSQPGRGSTGRQRSALGDCIEQLSDTVEELGKALEEIRHLRRGEAFRWQMSNAETWVSAALTNEDTCLDGFQGVSGEVKADVRRRITAVARVTSNALYMINRLDDNSRGRP